MYYFFSVAPAAYQLVQVFVLLPAKICQTCVLVPLGDSRKKRWQRVVVGGGQVGAIICGSGAEVLERHHRLHHHNVPLKSRRAEEQKSHEPGGSNLLKAR